jgi:hypothetical protein
VGPALRSAARRKRMGQVPSVRIPPFCPYFPTHFLDLKASKLILSTPNIMNRTWRNTANPRKSMIANRNVNTTLKLSNQSLHANQQRNLNHREFAIATQNQTLGQCRLLAWIARPMTAPPTPTGTPHSGNQCFRLIATIAHATMAACTGQ